MADINARTRLLIGTTAEWAAHNLVLGAGELVVERAGAQLKLKVGDGSAAYSALPFVTAEAVIPPEYLTQTEGDAAYLKLADVSAVSAANKVTRMGGNGKLAYGVLPLPPYVAASTGAAEAGNLVALSPAGKIDPSMVTVTTGGYKGVANLTAAKPAGTFLAGDYFINSTGGTADASWGLPAATPVAPGQQIIFNGATWDLIGGTGGAFLPTAGGTLTGPLLINPVGAPTELEVRDTTSTAQILINQQNADINSFAELRLQANDRLTRITAYGSTHNVRANQTWLNLADPTGTLVLATANTERMRLDPVGNLGVGTTNPAISGYGRSLVVNANGNYAAMALLGANGGDFKVLSTFSGNIMGQLSIDSANGSSAFMRMQVWDGAALVERMRIDTAGNVGIGTAAPNVLNGFTNLVINHAGAQSPILIFSRSGVTTGQIAGQANIFSIDSTGNPLGLFTAGTERVRIDTAGRVGIGVTGPATTLDVKTHYSFGDPQNGAIKITDQGDSNGSWLTRIGGLLITDNMTYSGGGQYMPYGAAASSINMSGGGINFTTNSGLTAGTPFAPITRVTIDPGGALIYGGNEVGWRNTPRTTVAAAYNILDSDRGRMLILVPGASVNVQPNFVGADGLVSFLNASGSVLTLNQGSGFSLYTGGTNTTGNKTLAPNAMGTIYFYNGTTAVVNGSGVS